MKLLRIKIQDGENTYDEFCIVNDKKQAEEYADQWCDGFERAVKNYDIIDISEEERQVLEKFGVV